MFKAKRRLVVLAATALAGVALAVVLLTGWATGGNSGVTDVAGSASAVLYQAGHRPLAPDFTATTLTGAPLSFSSYRGQVVVLNFWGSWCAPCRAEAPALAVRGQAVPAGRRGLPRGGRAGHDRQCPGLRSQLRHRLSERQRFQLGHHA